MLPRIYLKWSCMNRPCAGENSSWRIELSVAGGIVVWLTQNMPSTLSGKRGSSLLGIYWKQPIWRGLFFFCVLSFFFFTVKKKKKKKKEHLFKTILHFIYLMWNSTKYRRGHFPMGAGNLSFFIFFFCHLFLDHLNFLASVKLQGKFFPFQ